MIKKFSSNALLIRFKKFAESAQTQIFFHFFIQNLSLILALSTHVILSQKEEIPKADLNCVHIEICSQSRLIVEIVKKQQPKHEFWWIHHKSARNSEVIPSF